MILVIDAYNILKMITAHSYINDRQRNDFLQQLGRYGSYKGHKMVAVFDGGPYDRPYKERVYGVYVVYSGTQESADDYIRFYIEKHKNDDLIIISSDRSINRYAQQHGVESLDALAFYRFLQDTIKKAAQHNGVQRNKIIKTSDTENPELDALMQEHAQSYGAKQEEVTAHRVPSAQKPSKVERALKKKIRKL